MVDEDINSNDGFIKPSFDGRQHFYKTLNKYQEMLGAARYANNYYLMEKSLRGFLMMVWPYISQPEEIKTKLDLIKKYLGHSRFIKQFKDHIELLIDTASSDLFNKSKYMMLPFKEDIGGEFDLETFFRESDL